jgi:hypothetical protein
MKIHLPDVPVQGRVVIDTVDAQPTPDGSLRLATRDHDIIQSWAARHGAEPATGAATASGPATVNVNDGGASIRFNFPGIARFRPISWAEWFEHFHADNLIFLYDEEVADRAFELWQGRGGTDGSDREDWLQAEQQLRAGGQHQSGRYRLVQQATPNKG